MAKRKRKLDDESRAVDTAPVEDVGVEHIDPVVEVEAVVDPVIEEDEVYLPPRINLEGMTKDQLAALSMRHFGVRPNEKALKHEQVDELRRKLRAGRPSYSMG